MIEVSGPIGAALFYWFTWLLFFIVMHVFNSLVGALPRRAKKYFDQ